MAIRVCGTGEIEISNMNQDKLKDLLKQSEVPIERQADCPDDYQLASYMDGGLSERDHGGFEVHVADCAFCIERIGILGRAGEMESSTATPAQVRAQASRRSHWRRAPGWAAAALVVLAVGFVANQQSVHQVPADINELTSPPIVTERYVEQTSPIPELLSPLAGSSVDREKLVFKWKAVPDSLFYDIRIVSNDGEMITRQRVWDTQWPLPADTQLQADTEYFVRVDAYVSEARALSSEHIVFKIEGKQ